jgi:hypothetical protein
MDVAPVGPEIKDWIPDNLARSVVRDVAAPAGFVHVNATLGERFRTGQDVRAAAVASHPEGQDVRVLEKQQNVACPPGLTVCHERPLQAERFGVRHRSQPANVKISHTAGGPEGPPL